MIVSHAVVSKPIRQLETWLTPDIEAESRVGTSGNCAS